MKYRSMSKLENTIDNALHYCDPGPLNKESFYLFTVDEVFLIVPHDM